MRIELITKEQHATLLQIYKEHSNLTLQKDGYEYISSSKLTEADKQALDVVTEMLKKHITGFQKFNNFKIDRKNRLVLRFQYNWTADEPNPSYSFSGVGYLGVDELLNGFDK